jgi:cytochrome c oxidase subunit 4
MEREDSMSASGDDTRHYVKAYLRVFAALMILTVVTVAAASLHMAVPLAIAVALLIAILKGSLVASFFMHLISERPAVFAALVLTLVLFGALMALPVLTTLDSLGTPLAPAAGQATSAAARH